MNIRSLLLCLTLSRAITVFAAEPPTEAAIVVPDADTPNGRFGYEGVLRLITTKPESFKSAEAIARMRPIPKQEIAEIKVKISGLYAPDGKESAISYTSLPDGLEFMAHPIPQLGDNPAHMEMAVNVFGMGDVLYVNDLPLEPGIPEQSPKPNIVHLTSGQLFSTSEPFTLEVEMGVAVPSITQCKAERSTQASVIHSSLTGKAVLFNCRNDFDGLVGVAKIWYLEDAARYLQSENWDDDKLESKMEVLDVKFR